MNVKLVTVNHLSKVMPDRSGVMEESYGNLYRGQVSSFQLVIETDEIIIDGRLLIKSDFKNILVQRVGYVPSSLPVREGHDDYIISDKMGLYPDSLLEVDLKKLRLAPKVPNVFFISVFGDSTLRDGKYPLEISLYNKDKKLSEIDYQLNLITLELEPSDIIYTNWVHYDSISLIHQEEVFTERYYRILEKYLSLAIKNGMNMLLIPLFTPPLDTYVGGERLTTQLLEIEYSGNEYYFDFGKLKYFLDFSRKLGIKYFEFPPFFTQWGAEYAPKFIVEVDNKPVKKFGWDTYSLSAEYVSFLKQLLPKLKEFLMKEGIAEKCYFHISDESDKLSEHYQECRELLESNLNGFKFADTVTKFKNNNNNSFYNILSISEAEIALENGHYPEGIYYCWCDYKNYVSNRFFSMPLERVAVIWLQLYLNNAKIFLHWGYNFYNDFLSYNYINPYFTTDAGGVFPSGDAYIVYPNINKEGVNSSIRLEALGYGLRLYQMLKTLEKQTSKNYVKEFLLNQGLKGYQEYPRKAGWLKDFENILRAEILKR